MVEVYLYLHAKHSRFSLHPQFGAIIEKCVYGAGPKRWNVVGDAQRFFFHSSSSSPYSLLLRIWALWTFFHLKLCLLFATWLAHNWITKYLAFRLADSFIMQRTRTNNHGLWPPLNTYRCISNHHFLGIFDFRRGSRARNNRLPSHRIDLIQGYLLRCRRCVFHMKLTFSVFFFFTPVNWHNSCAVCTHCTDWSQKIINSNVCYYFHSIFVLV